MALFIGIALALVSIALLARPMFSREQTAPRSASDPNPLQDVQWRQQQVYDDIKTVILDHELGNIPPEEYEEMLGTYRLRAADLLRQQEQLLHALTSLEKEIEDKVLALRMSWGTVNEVTVCGRCGGMRDLEAIICPRCELPSEEEVYPTEEHLAEEEARG